jgi:hypothetical protein
MPTVQTQSRTGRRDQLHVAARGEPRREDAVLGQQRGEVPEGRSLDSP